VLPTKVTVDQIGLKHYRDNVKIDAHRYTDHISALTKFQPNFCNLMLTNVDVNLI
jgi:hypothetical protein